LRSLPHSYLVVEAAVWYLGARIFDPSFASNAGGRKAHGQRSLPYYAGLISTAEFDPAKFNHDGPASLLGSGAGVVSSALLYALDLLGIIDHQNRDMVTIGRVVLTSHEQPRAHHRLGAFGQGLMGTRLRYPYEVRSEKEYFDEIQDVKVTKDMLRPREAHRQSEGSRL
jgi:hypothetical protein